MNHRYAFGFLLTALSLMSAVPRAYAATPNVILSEIAWAGSEKSTADEWIELANLDEITIDVSGWNLSGIGVSGSIISLPAGATIAPHGTYLVANYASGEKSTLLISPDDVTTSVSIPNTALAISLFDSSGTLIDSMNDPGTPDFGSSSSFSTMERSLIDFSWATAESSTNLLNGQFGSPGVIGHVIAEIIESPSVSLSETEAHTTTETAADQVPSSSPGLPTENNTTIIPPLSEESIIVEMILPEASSTESNETPTTITDPSTELVDPALSVIDSTSNEALQLIETLTLPESNILPSDNETTVNVVSAVLEEAVSDAPTVEVSSSDSEKITEKKNATLAITAFLAAPNTGEDEWIELTNIGTIDLDVTSHSIADASGKSTALSGIITAGGTLIITNPKGALNNDGDTITILGSDGSIIDSVIYGTDDLEAPKKGMILRNINGAWTKESVILIAETETATMIPPHIETTVTTEVTAESSIQTVETSMEFDTETTVSTEEVPSMSDVPSSSPDDDQKKNAIISAGDLVISALFPTPETGNDEWVAITNTSNAAIDLSDLSIVDASGAETPLSGMIDSGETVSVTNPKGKLNNNGDTVSLINGTTTLDVVSYGTETVPAPKKGETLTYYSSSLPTLSPTITYDEKILETRASTDAPTTTLASSSSRNPKTRTNPVAPASTGTTATHSAPSTPSAVTLSSPSKSSLSTRRSSTSKAANAPKQITIADIDSLADDTLVMVDGIVIGDPGVIGKRSFFIDGLEIYQSQGDLADVTIGDRVRVTGAISVLSDHRRVNIKEGAITVLGSGTASPHTTHENIRYGNLVRVSGVVSARNGNDVILLQDDGSSVVLSAARSVAIAWNDLAGKKVTATGIAKIDSKGMTVVLRNGDDLVVEPEDEPLPVAAGTTQSSFPWMELSLAILGAIGLGFWFWKHRPASSKIPTLSPLPT